MQKSSHDNIRWLDLIDDIDNLTKVSTDIWKAHQNEPQFEYTGRLDIDFDDILSLEPEAEPFHTQSIGKIGQTLHQGMIKNNQIRRHEFPSDHNIHSQIAARFSISKSQIYLNVQEPGNVCGIHVDKYRTHMTRGQHDFKDTLTKDIFSGVVFCTDWEIGQVFLSGTGAITGWKQGDSYTFPWYMPHGSANAGAKDRYLLQFVGELTKK